MLAGHPVNYCIRQAGLASRSSRPAAETHHSPTHPRTRTPARHGVGDNIGPEISIVFSSETILAFPEVIMWKSRFCRIAFPCVSFRDRWTPCQAGRVYWNPRGDNNSAGGWVAG